MNAYILTIGDEILIGQVTDTNATYMAEALDREGFEVVEHLSVADSREGITQGLDRALAVADVVLMTGGLGPTKDDITKKVLAEYVGTELVFHQPTWERLQKIYRSFGREAQQMHRVQCELPGSATILTNKRGTAPGMWLEHNGKVIVSMPGVPYEMRYLVKEEVLPKLRPQLWNYEQHRSLTILTAGAGESTIAEMIETVEDNLPDNVSLAYLPNLGTVRLRLSARGDNQKELEQTLDFYRERIEAIIGKLVYGYGKKDLALVVQEKMQAQGLTLATAESCTGGSVAAMITRHPGSSGHFMGSVVAYANAVKEQLLGVPGTVLREHGAVSEATIRAMAEGVRARLGTDYGIATSGVAGPGGGTPDKPVGTIWIAVAGPDGTKAKLLTAGKDRRRNITYTVHHVLNALRLALDGEL